MLYGGLMPLPTADMFLPNTLWQLNSGERRKGNIMNTITELGTHTDTVRSAINQFASDFFAQPRTPVDIVNGEEPLSAFFSLAGGFRRYRIEQTEPSCRWVFRISAIESWNIVFPAIPCRLGYMPVGSNPAAGLTMLTLFGDQDNESNQPSKLYIMLFLRQTTIARRWTVWNRTTFWFQKSRDTVRRQTLSDNNPR